MAQAAVRPQLWPETLSLCSSVALERERSRMPACSCSRPGVVDAESPAVDRGCLGTGGPTASPSAQRSSTVQLPLRGSDTPRAGAPPGGAGTVLDMSALAAEVRHPHRAAPTPRASFDPENA